MTNFPTWTPVVALALFAAGGRLLLQQRAAHKHHGGCWEFPGGKVESDEFPRVALAREIDEELGLKLETDQLECACFSEESGEKHIVLFLYISFQDCGEPVARDGQSWGWFSLAEASALDLAPMDRDLLQQIARRAP